MRTSLQLVLVVALCCLGIAVSAEEDAPITADPRVREVTTMIRGGLSTAVILAKVEDIGAFPELSADDLVTLKGMGVPEPVLVRMIQLEEPGPPPTHAADAPPLEDVGGAPAEAPSPTSTDQVAALLVVEIERPFPITSYEVVVDGEVVATAGRLWRGESQPGETLQRPSRVRGGKHLTAVELEVPPGEHEIAVGFAVTLVENDADNLTDPWGKVVVERYLNRGVRALESPAEEFPGDWGVPTSTRCVATVDEPCTVVAILEGTAPTRLGGLPVYGVSYR